MSIMSVIYAKDILRVAEFYERALRLSVIERNDEFIFMSNEAIEISVIQIPEAIGAGIHISSPPRVREETPIKCSYLVDDLSRVHAAAVASGGGSKPVTQAWLWRGNLHLDGYDPEGNVVQFRRRA